MADRNQRNLNDRIQWWREQPDDKEMLQALFTPIEFHILEAIRQFEILDSVITQRLKENYQTGSVVETFIKIEEEAGISFRLKEYFMQQMDFLLEKGTPETWMDIMIWYSLLEERKFIIEDYWEFPVLRKMMDIYMKELDVFLEMGGTFQISILSLHSMKELMEAYFRIIFLCRRVEYSVEPMEEIVEYIDKMKLSSVFVWSIIEKAQIYNKKKVIHMLEERCWK